MVGREDQQVTIRLLPAGAPRGANIDKLDGRLLRLDLLTGSDPESIKAGDLVEIETPTMLYLGVVRSHQREQMAVAIEHALDRETLAAIQQVWHGPAGT